MALRLTPSTLVSVEREELRQLKAWAAQCLELAEMVLEADVNFIATNLGTASMSTEMWEVLAKKARKILAAKGKA